MWPRSKSRKTKGGGSRIRGKPGRTSRGSRRRPRRWFFEIECLTLRPPLLSGVVRRQNSDCTVANGDDCPLKEKAMFRRISFVAITFVLVTSWSHLRGADPPDDPVEKALAAFCEKQKLA